MGLAEKVSQENYFQEYISIHHPKYFSSMKEIYTLLKNTNRSDTIFMDKMLKNTNEEIWDLIEQDKEDEALKIQKQLDKKVDKYLKNVSLQTYAQILDECYGLTDKYSGKIRRRIIIDNKLELNFRKDNFEKFGLYSKLEMWYSVKIHEKLNKIKSYINGKDV